MKKYIVMECHPGYAVLLDEEGRFLKAANLHYETGQTIENPVLMREGPSGQQKIIRWARGGFAAAAACFLMLFGLRYYQNNLLTYSSIYLTINPQVQMDLNRKGTVVRLSGANEDGVLLLENYDGKGKDKITVTDELIDRAIDMGFLSEGGQISFSIDAPDETLLQEYGAELQDEVLRHLEDRFTITVEIVNYQTGETESSGDTGAAPVVQETQEIISIPIPSGTDGDSDYGDSDYGSVGGTDYGSSGGSDDSDSDYGLYSDGVTDYADTDYGPGSDGVTDYTDSNYGAEHDSSTDYGENSAPEADSSSNYEDSSGSEDSSDYGADSYETEGESAYSDDSDDD